MTYVPQTWADGTAGGTPITAARLAHMEQGILSADNIVFCGETPGVARPAIDAPLLWLTTVDQVNSDDTRDVTVYISLDNGTGGTGDGTVLPHTHTYAVDDIEGLRTELDAKSLRIYTKRTITASYTLVAADAIDMVMHSTAASAITITLPAAAAATIAVETVIPWRAYGAGQVTFVAGTGATLVSRGSAFASAGQYAEGTATKVGTNAWLLSGDLA